MDLRHLRTFVAVADQRTVSKASVQLHVAQPALSRQIRDLEEELGLKLFDRVHRRLVLTSEGEQLLEDCRTVLGAVHSLSERARQLRRGDTGLLRVAATPQTIDGVFSSFLHQFAERYPNVRIKLTEGVGAELLAVLERGDVHVTVALIQPSQADNPLVGSFQLPPLEFFACFPKSPQPGIGGNVEIRRLATYPLLLLDASFYVRTTFDAACRLAGVKPNVYMESRSPHALLALAEAGHGVAIVPSVQPTNRYRLKVACITHRRRPLREAYAVLWDKRRLLPACARDFCESLAAHMRKVSPVLRSRARRTDGGAKRVARRGR